MYVDLSQWNGLIGAVLGVIAGGYATYRIEKLKIKNNEREQRRQVCSQLRGAKIRALQSYASYYSAFIEAGLADGYLSLEVVVFRRGDESIVERGDEIIGESIGEGMDKIRKNTSESLAYQAVIENKRRYASLQSELADNRGRMWETLSTIQILFPNTEVIDELINQIEQHEDNLGRFEKELKEDKNKKFDLQKLIEESSKFPSTQTNINHWSKKKSAELQDWYDVKTSILSDLIDALDESIENLSDIIRKEIDKENLTRRMRYAFQHLRD